MPNLKSTTALAVSLSLAMPGIAPAQNADTGYPCIGPSGETVQNKRQLSRAILTYLEGEEASDRGNFKDAEACTADAIQAAIDEGGDELNAAMGAAPEDRLAALTDALSTAGTQAELTETTDDVADEEAAEAETAPSDDAGSISEEEIAEEEPAEPDATTEEAAQIEEPEATSEPTAENASEQAPEEISEAESMEETADASTGEQAIETERSANVEEKSDPEGTESAEATVVPEESSAETDETAEADTTGASEPSEADVAEMQAGEAGGTQLTDAERQDLAQAREEENRPAAAAAAAADTEDAQAEAEADVETQTVAEDDVRSAADEFETSLSSVPQSNVTPRKDKGLTDFEKALVLGVGAAVVGSILKNGDQVVSNSRDRVVVERDGELRVLKDDDVLLRRPGAHVETRRFNDGSTRTLVRYEDGSEIVTVRSADGAVLRRTLNRASDGAEIVLFDDTETIEPVAFEDLPEIEAIEEMQRTVALEDQEALREALRQTLAADVGRSFSLRQIRDYKRVRALAPQIELEALTFETGSAAIQPDQAEALGNLGWAIRDIVDEDPGAVFLVEGHTDAVGSASYNLALSDRRAETVALALTEYFDVPPQNLITQGYGESDLKIRVLTTERANRRAAVRNITELLSPHGD